MRKKIKNKINRIKRRIKNAPLSSYVVFSIVLLLLYSIIELVTSTLTSISHDTLTTCFFGVFGGEILSCALIKIFKLREEDNNEQ